MPSEPTAPERRDDLSHDEAELLMSKTWDGEVTSVEADRLVAHLQHCRESPGKGRRWPACCVRSTSA